MKKLDEKKWRRFDVVLQIIFTAIAVILADIVSEKFLNDSFVMELLCCVVFVIILIPIQILIEQIVKQSVFLRKPFEKNEEEK